MIPRLTPAEIRTGARLMKIYSYAAEQILAEEQAADETHTPSTDAMVAGRLAEWLSTPEGRSQFVEYLDRLKATHGDDPDMAMFIGLSWNDLADAIRDERHDGPAPADQGAAA